MTAMNIALDASGPKEADQRAITGKQMSVAHPTNFFENVVDKTGDHKSMSEKKVLSAT